jgi:hypothetical protein
MMDCERADVMRRVLTVHGIKNLTNLEDIMEYATTERELECQIEGRSYVSKDPRTRLWGRPVSFRARHTNPSVETLKLHTLLVRAPAVIRFCDFVLRPSHGFQTLQSASPNSLFPPSPSLRHTNTLTRILSSFPRNPLDMLATFQLIGRCA